MKKMVGKLSLLVMAMCMLLVSPVIISHAADGTLDFSPSEIMSGAGDEITVSVTAATSGDAIGDVDITAEYDTSALEFVRGTNVTDNFGKLSLSARGTGTETSFTFEMVFKTLKESTSTIEITDSVAYLYNDESLYFPLDSITVTVDNNLGQTSNGRETMRTSEANIDIRGTLYGIYENFTAALIPDGFSETTVQYDGAEHNAIVQDVSGKKFVFLVTGSEDPIMAMYDEISLQFIVAAPVSMAEDSYILILDKEGDTELPAEFAETTLNLNGTIFPAWQNMSSTDYYLVYALSYMGTEGYYQYDSVEQSYQRYNVPEKEDTQEGEKEETILDKVKGIIDQYLLYIAGVIAAIILILIIVIIVLSVKLGNRNAEIDDLYDELDGKARSRKKETTHQNLNGYDDDDYDDYDDDDFDDEEYDEYEDDDYNDDEYDSEYADEYDADGYDDEYEDDGYDDDEYDSEYEDEYEDDEYDSEYDDEYDSEYEDEYEDDEYEAEYDDEYEEDTYGSGKKKGSGRSSGKGGDYNINFIDL